MDAARYPAPGQPRPGHDDRAKEPQPVAGRRVPRFCDWQLAQSPGGSWRECHLHARNMLGRDGDFNLLGEVLRNAEAGRGNKALQFSCDLDERESLDRCQGQGFPMGAEDGIRIFAAALNRQPQEHRPEGLAAAQEILSETGVSKPWNNSWHGSASRPGRRFTRKPRQI